MLLPLLIEIFVIFTRIFHRAAARKFPGGISLPNLVNLMHANHLKNPFEVLANVLRHDLEEGQIEKIFSTVTSLPVIDIKVEIKECNQNERTSFHIDLKQSGRMLFY